MICFWIPYFSELYYNDKGMGLYKTACYKKDRKVVPGSGICPVCKKKICILI